MPQITLKKFLLFTGLACLFGVLFIGFTLLVRANITDQIDFNLTVKTQNKVPVRLDEYLTYFTVLAKFQVMLVVLVIGLALFRKWVGIITTLGLFFFAHVTEIIGKGFLSHPPPPFMFYRHPTEHIFPELHTFEGSSYPSGHSMRIVYVAVTFSYLVWQSKKLPLPVKLGLWATFAGVVLITCITRFSLGEHWPSDVVGGVLLGMVSGVFGLVFL